MIDETSKSSDPSLDSILSSIHKQAVGTQFAAATPTAVADGKIVIHDDGSGDTGLSLKTAEGNIITFSPSTMATQAQMETGTSTAVVVTPGRQKNHPLSPKAWCMFNGGTAGTNAPTVGSGVTSVEKVSTGLYNITFSTAFSTGNYAVIGTADYTSSNSNKVMVVALTSATVCQITTTKSDNNVIDCAIVSIMAFGDQ